MREEDERHRRWSLWAAINLAHALKDAGLVAGPDEDRVIAVAKDQLFELLTEPGRWANAFPGSPAG